MKALILFCLLCGLASSAAAQTFYRWQDASGATHYTTRPPNNASSNSVDVSNYQPTASSPPSAPQQAADNTTSDAPKKAGNNLKQVCDGYRKNLAQLKSGKTLVTTDKNGKKHLLSKTQRAQIKANAIQALKACAPATS